VRSRKPSTSAPDRPNIEAEKAVPMPASGRASPVLSCSNSALRSPEPTDIPAITSDTAPTVFSRPQKVPSRPRKISRPVMYRESSRLSSSREAMPSSRLRIAVAERVKRAWSVRLCASRAASMLAIGASSFGEGREASRGRAVW
jgi:hypothetical protein